MLLGELQRIALNEGWIVAKFEVRREHSFAEELATALFSSLRTARRQDKEGGKLHNALRVFKSFTLSMNLGVFAFEAELEPAAGYAASGRLSTDLTDLLVELGEAARSAGIGVLILVDELQEAESFEMAALSTAMHQINQTSPVLPVFLVGAGLPSLPSQLASANSYAERLYQFRTLSVLGGDQDARAALVQPVIERDVSWDEGALRIALDAATGYPYFCRKWERLYGTTREGRFSRLRMPSTAPTTPDVR